MAVQTSYSTTHAAAYAGMLADGEVNNNVSKLNGTDAVIPFGLGVIGSGEQEMALPDAGSTGSDLQNFVFFNHGEAGICSRSPARELGGCLDSVPFALHV